MTRRQRLTLIEKPGVLSPIPALESLNTESRRSEALRLLVAIVSQARMDGMVAAHMKVSPERQASAMSYFGPAEDGVQRWRELVAPPCEAYGPLVQAVVSSAAIESTIPFGGCITMWAGRKQIDVHFRVDSLYELYLAWGVDVWELAAPGDEQVR